MNIVLFVAMMPFNSRGLILLYNFHSTYVSYYICTWPVFEYLAVRFVYYSIFPADCILKHYCASCSQSRFLCTLIWWSPFSHLSKSLGSIIILKILWLYFIISSPDSQLVLSVNYSRFLCFTPHYMYGAASIMFWPCDLFARPKSAMCSSIYFAASARIDSGFLCRFALTPPRLDHKSYTRNYCRKIVCRILLQLNLILCNVANDTDV